MSRRPKEAARFAQIKEGLEQFRVERHPLPGLSSDASQACFIEQMIDSLHRVEYVERIRNRPISIERKNPNSNLFCPLRAAILFTKEGNIDEAFWLTFLSTHFGPHQRYGWNIVRDIYKGEGNETFWNWHKIIHDPTRFQAWMYTQYQHLRGTYKHGFFGNHRKYETLDPASDRGTHRVLESYVDWVGANRGHKQLLAQTVPAPDCPPEQAFEALYNSMSQVYRFGRTAKFDFLCMIGKLKVANISPGKPYLEGSTGPLYGARLAFDGATESHSTAKQLEPNVIELANFLGIGMQEAEDSLCNWQKSPIEYEPFRG